MTLKTLKAVSTRLRTTLLGSVSVLLTLFSIIGLSPSAAAVTCRNITNPTYAGGFSEGNFNVGYSVNYTVPGSNVSGCQYINVNNINIGGGNCWYFRVRLFPTSGGSIVLGDLNHLTCAGPNDVVAIGNSTVLNGTLYRYEWEGFAQITFNGRD